MYKVTAVSGPEYVNVLVLFMGILFMNTTSVSKDSLHKLLAVS